MSGRDCRDLDTAWLHLAKGFTNGHLSPQVSTGETQVLASSSPAFSWQCPHLPCSPGSPLFMCLVMQFPFSCAWLQAWPSLPWDMRGAPWLSGLGAYIMDVRTGHSNVCYRQSFVSVITNRDTNRDAYLISTITKTLQNLSQNSLTLQVAALAGLSSRQDRFLLCILLHSL